MGTNSVLSYDINISESSVSQMTTTSLNISYNNVDLHLEFQTTMPENLGETKQSSKGMIEKWLLVLLIVGGTSLVFIICFPIDFYLYRRRKRQSRERNKFPNFEPKASTRAGQCHASAEVKQSIASVWAEDIRRKNVTKGGFARVVSIIRKKQQEEKLAQQTTPVATSSKQNTSEPEVSILTETPQACQSYAFPKISATLHPKSSIEEIPSGSDVPNNFESPFLSIPRRQLSNLSAAWTENEELVDREIKCYNYGALGSVDETSLAGPSDKQQCYTIPMSQPTKLMFVRSGDENSAETNTDTDDVQMSSASEHRYSSHDSQEFSYPSREFQEVKYSKMVPKCTSDSNLSCQTFRGHGGHRPISDSSSDDTLTEPTISRSVLSLMPTLERSASDQSMWVTKKNRSPQSKRNRINPSEKVISYSMEQFIVRESEENTLESGSTKSPRLKKKRKKKSFLKKKSSDSIQNLSSESQKY